MQGPEALRLTFRPAFDFELKSMTFIAWGSLRLKHTAGSMNPGRLGVSRHEVKAEPTPISQLPD